ASDRGGLHAVAAERSIERAIRIVADQGEVDAGGALVAIPGNDNLAVGLNLHALSSGTQAERGGLLAVAAKRSIERAIRVVTDHREVVAARAYGYNLAVRLNRHVVTK